MKDNNLKQLYNRVNIVSLFMMLGLILYHWSRLPDRIPIHFDGSGIPNGWGGKSNLYIFLAVALGLTALMYGINLLIPKMRKRPQWLNIPNKDKFLALPEEKQQVYWDLVAEYMAGTAASINLVFLILTWGTIQVALQKWQAMPGWTLWTLVILVLGINALYLPRMITLPKKLASQSPSNPN